MADTSSTADLIRRIQQRLLIARCLDQLYRGLWLSALIACAGAFAHAAVGGVDPRYVLFAALVPLLVMPAWALAAHRPARAAAAAAGDRWFDANALLVSATEMLYSSAPPPAGAGVVIAQAERAAHRWLAGLRARPVWQPPPPLTVAVGLIMAGTFALSLPGAGATAGGDRDDPSTQPPSNAQSRPQGLGRSSRDRAPGAAAFYKPTHPMAAQTKGPAEPVRTPRVARLEAQATAAGGAAPDPASSGPANRASPRAGDAPASATAPDTKAPAKAHIRVRYVTVDPPPGERGRTGAAVGLRTAGGKATGPAHGSSPAGAAAPGADIMALSPWERRYVADYLRSVGKIR